MDYVAETAGQGGEIIAAGEGRLDFRRAFRNDPVRAELALFRRSDEEAADVVLPDRHVDRDGEDFLVVLQSQIVGFYFGDVGGAAIRDGGAVEVAKHGD